MRVALFFSAALCFAGQPLVLKLWPPRAPDTKVVELGADGEHRARDVNTPTITVHLPDAAKANGTAVVICPGGGYMTLAVDKEGHDVARWLNTIGVAGIVLEYRTIPSSISQDERSKLLSKFLMPLAQEPEFAQNAIADLREAMRMLRENAKDWRIDPARIGVLGFSAGGHLILNLALNPEPGIRPAFFVPIYGLAPEGAEFPAGTGPMFLLHAHDDPLVKVSRAYAILAALDKAQVPVESHIYRDGGHGFGIRKKGRAIDGWPDRLRDWMQANGWLGKTP
ncbi:MAG: alpha/beta hydrolase [Bryobacteraceae bacterium]